MKTPRNPYKPIHPTTLLSPTVRLQLAKAQVALAKAQRLMQIQATTQENEQALNALTQQTLQLEAQLEEIITKDHST